MMEDQRPSGPHDPYVDVLGFMRCTDRVVSYGFPRAASDPKYTRYILQYEGTKKRGNVLVNDANGDIATIDDGHDKLPGDGHEAARWRT